MNASRDSASRLEELVRELQGQLEAAQAFARSQGLEPELVPRFLKVRAKLKSVALVEVALVDGRDAATPDDVKEVAKAALRHRILPTYYATAERVTTDQMVDEILATVNVP